MSGQSFVVDRILDSRMKSGKREFFIKWEGYTSAYNTWEVSNYMSFLVSFWFVSARGKY